MVRLHLVVEGQTEETFINSMLVDHLSQYEIYADARCVETSRSRRRRKIHRGGMTDYARAKRDLQRWMKEDANIDAVFGTMFDLYHLPHDFPELEEAKKCPDPYYIVEMLEKALAKDINHPRFVPYIQLHEFEALILSDPSKLELEFINRRKAIEGIIAMCSAFKSPELIDDGDETAPSKRIINILPDYEGRKASAGPITAQRIGLPTIRKKCPHFNEWLGRIEALGRQQEK
ncbi:MAG TPA: DUF4276 family protein [bacterium]|nr:DUF4276 family protein [bacterium]